MFSIIIAVYNNERYLPNAIDSVLSQKYDDFEIIIVNDGSTDKTGDIADAYAEKNSRIKVIHQQNQWIYASFNRGIREAKGEYVYILNSDDKLRPNILKELDERVKKYHPDVIWTVVLSHICDENQNIILYNRGREEDRTVQDAFYDSVESVRNAWPYFEKAGLSRNQANLYKRELALACPFRNDVYGADVLFNIGIAPSVKSAYVLSIPAYDHFVYNQPGMNASVGKYYEYEHEMFNEIYWKFINLFESWKLNSETYEKFFANKRMKELSFVINKLRHSQCKMNTNEKVKTIFTVYMDDTMQKVADILDAQEEVESRILSGLRTLLVGEQLSEKDEMYFAYEMLDSLLRYEKDESDMRKIENAINHPLNPYGIGKTFYNKLIKV